jgi:hypothetical protein
VRLSPKRTKMNKAKGFMKKLGKNLVIQKMMEDAADVEKKPGSPLGELLLSPKGQKPGFLGGATNKIISSRKMSEVKYETNGSTPTSSNESISAEFREREDKVDISSSNSGNSCFSLRDLSEKDDGFEGMMNCGSSIRRKSHISRGPEKLKAIAFRDSPPQPMTDAKAKKSQFLKYLEFTLVDFHYQKLIEADYHNVKPKQIIGCRRKSCEGRHSGGKVSKLNRCSKLSKKETVMQVLTKKLYTRKSLNEKIQSTFQQPLKVPWYLSRKENKNELLTRLAKQINWMAFSY